MRPVLTALIGAAVVVSGAAPAFAQAGAKAGADGDARCILVMNVVGRDPKNEANAAKGIFYFLGKIAGHGQTAQLEPLLAAAGRQITNDTQFKAELTRCGAEMNVSGTRLTGAFQHLQAQTGKPQPAGSPPK